MPRIPAEIAHAMDRAMAFAWSPKLLSALQAASAEPDLWKLARKSPGKFLELRGVEVPTGLNVDFLDHRGKPVPPPESEPFRIRLFNCRTYYARKKDHKGFEEFEVCFGFEVTSQGVSPIGR